MLKIIFLLVAQALARKPTTIAIAFIGVFLSIQPVSAGDKILSYRQFVEGMVAETDSVYQLTNAIIRLDPDTDHQFSTTTDSRISGATPSPLVIDKAVRLTHVRFEGSAHFRNLRFHQKLSLESVIGDPWLTFDSCDFFADVDLSNVEPWIYIKNSRFHRNISHFNIQHPIKLKIVESDFLPSKFADLGEQSHGDNYRLRAAGFNQMGGYFEVWNTVFPWTSDRDKVILWGDHGVVSILGNTFDIPLILGAKIAREAREEHC